MEKRESNYEIMKHRMQKEFAASDLDAICREWELERAEGALQLTLLGQTYRIDRTSGAVLRHRGGAWQEADFNVSMTLFDILTRPRQTASGELLPVSALSAVNTATVPAGGFFDRAAKRFERHCEALAAACERLGGIPYSRGDVSYLLPVFRDLRFAVRFWDSDEEFGPELSFLCDGNILHFMHFETVMFLLCHVTDRLTALLDEGEAA